mgnify:CR=1 FL=1
MAQEQTRDLSENQKQTSQNNGNAVTRTIAGSVIGAAAGYITSPENRKKMKEQWTGLDQEKLKQTSRNIGQTAKTKVSQATGSIKKSAGNLFESPSNGSQTNNKTEHETTRLEDIAPDNPEDEENMDALLDTLQEENDQLKERLDAIEGKLTKLVESEQEKTSKSSTAKERQKNTNQTSTKQNNPSNDDSSASNDNTKKAETEVDHTKSSSSQKKKSDKENKDTKNEKQAASNKG